MDRIIGSINKFCADEAVFYNKQMMDIVGQCNNN
jgi:hypothetical protein